MQARNTAEANQQALALISKYQRGELSRADVLRQRSVLDGFATRQFETGALSAQQRDGFVAQVLASPRRPDPRALLHVFVPQPQPAAPAESTVRREAKVSALTDLLKKAASAHHTYELAERKTRGDDTWVDPVWADWYAQNMMDAGAGKVTGLDVKGLSAALTAAAGVVKTADYAPAYATYITLAEAARQGRTADVVGAADVSSRPSAAFKTVGAPVTLPDGLYGGERKFEVKYSEADNAFVLARTEQEEFGYGGLRESTSHYRVQA